MIIATVTTCPQRWAHYRRLRGNYDALGLPFPLRSFQTSESLDQPRVNTNLNGRSALRYCQHHLASRPERNWVLYLEDDIRLHPPLRTVMPHLMEDLPSLPKVCWYLCNRRNPVRRQFRQGSLTLNELEHPMEGSHALMLPQCVLPALLARTWKRTVDAEMFEALRCAGVPVVQIVKPVLVEHIGVYSTYHPHKRQELEVNHAD